MLSTENDHTKFYSARGLAKDYFNGMISYQAILKLTPDGLLPRIKQGKSYVYEKLSVDQWVQKNFSTPVWAKIKKVD